MQPERWKKIEELYQAAILQPPEKQGEFLRQACPTDAGLCAEVESLLKAAGEDSPFLEDSPLSANAEADLPTGTFGPMESAAGTVIGPYKLIQPIGQGGMGEVWLAEQRLPVRRRVAIKLIKAGMDTREVVARFESERQALALMDHPAIAKVFDAGSTPLGRPYFVMEYVSGVPITEYCDKHKLSMRRRLELFLAVCEGVQHAHQKAILHRDLKPSNILVAEVDGKPAPRIIDFGVAKATAQRLTADTMFTQVGAIVGTPGYMSPEQADSAGADVDTRTDVYSLGVVLYQLLVGVLPLDFSQTPREEFVRKLREQDTPRPSTRVRGLGEQSGATAQNRGADPPDLERQLRGDLDAITLKALEKERTRRYASASDLAADIGRYLRNEPVLAHRARAGYRARKYVRRHRAAVAFAAVIGLLLAAAAVAQTLELRRTRLERDRANRERERASRVTEFMTGMFKLSDPSAARGNDVKAREILDKASRDIETGLTEDQELRAQMMEAMGNVYGNLGLYAKADSLFVNALGIRQRVLGERNPDTLQSMYDLAGVLRAESRNPEAEKLARETLDTRLQVLGPENRDTVLSRTRLGTILNFEGRYPEAEKMHREALDIARRVYGPQDALSRSASGDLAIDLAEEGKYPEAEQAFRENLEETRRALGTDHPETLGALANFSQILTMEGKFADAEKVARDACAGQRRVFGPEHPKTLICMDTLASILYGEKRYADAEKLYRETIELDRKSLGPEHRSTLITMGNLADVLMVEGKYAEAEQLTRHTLEAHRRILGPDHSVTLYAMDRLGEVLKREKRYPQAEKALRDTLEARRRVLRPGHPNTARSAYELAEVLALEGKRAEAVSQLQWAIGNGLAAQTRKDLEKDADLKSLHGDPRFAALH